MPEVGTTKAKIIDEAAGDRINDFASFNAFTGEPRQVAGLYFYYKLDCLIDLAYAVAHDFYDKPHLFTKLPDGQGVSAVTTIAKLHARYGCDEQFLNRDQRAAIYAALFGKPASSDAPGLGEGSFCPLRDELLAACATFVETKFGDEIALRENVRQKHRLLKEYLTGLHGDSVRWSKEQSLSALTEKAAYPILRNQGVAAVYGISTPPTDDWPYTFDANANKLIEEVSKRLMGGQSTPMTTDGKPEVPWYVSREEITNLQRAALEGAKAIAIVLNVDTGSTDDEVNRLIRRCYTWATALRSLNGHSRSYSTALLPRAGEKPRGGVAMAQPMPNAAPGNRG
jgi:hypothetical protein